MRVIAFILVGVVLFLAGMLTSTASDTRTILAGVCLLLLALLLALSVRDRKEARRIANVGVPMDNRMRARAIFEMANTLGETLDYKKVTAAALDLGFLGLKDASIATTNELIGMVMLFHHDELRIISARGLTRQDEKVTARGEQGLLAKALDIAEPIVSGNVRNDPELGYFAGLQDARSVLIIPLRAGYQNYGVLVYAAHQDDAFEGDHLAMLAAIASQATIALQNATLYQNLRAEKERLVEVEEDARKKLARDLHDGPTQSISAIAMRVNLIKSNLLENKITPQKVAEELVKIEDIARRATKEMRHMLFTLRPLVLESQGLTAAVEQLAAKMKETHDLNVVVEAQPNVETLLEGHAQGLLFYIMEEAVNNARKHAQASKVTLRLYREDNYCIGEIEDNGVGFDISRINNNYESRGSLGMVNMRERAASIDGLIDIQSEIGKGTRIAIAVPIKVRPQPENRGIQEAASANAARRIPNGSVANSNNATAVDASSMRRPKPKPAVTR
ncbi:MAG: GAF domain-containing sensor histidine kinase [Anaerolineae bacterium]|nr:GAF domain-containing sensor histidine kinase [Anaerolineae bacterium]